MTIADDPQNPNAEKKAIEALAALRNAMAQRLVSPQTKDVQQPPREPTKPDAVKPQAAEDRHASADLPPLPSQDPTAWTHIFMRIAERSQKLILDFIERNNANDIKFPSLDPARITETFAGLSARIVNDIANDPQKFFDMQMAFWQGYANIWQTTLARMQGQSAESVVKPPPFDRRFQDKEWQTNWLFDYLKQIYLLTAQQVQNLVRKETAHLEPKLAQKIDFFTRQMVDASSPSNFWLTNPEVLRTTLETGGENIIKGLENLLKDLERGKGDLRISLTDTSAFRIGENLAITPGKVVYQNSLMQLIQYAPQTPTVHRVPLLIIPPWINKFYILDLREKNSFIRYLVQQGHTVFVVSWVNPDARHALVHFDDYMSDGVLTAMREVRRTTGADEVNAVGYCIGGTVLACTLAYLNATASPPADLPKVTSATYLVTMIDFAAPGDLGVFVDEELMTSAEELMAQKGYLPANAMAMVFNLLRANDLIWSSVVNNYLLGKEPVPFDILYWNSDSTNMPAVMQSYYLRKMYMGNKLVEPNGLSMKGVPINVRTITTPSFLLSTREDHIAPWASTYAATQLYQGPVTFTLASSGHIAGVVNHPTANKYGYWTNDSCPPSPDEWLKGATEYKGSWWPAWLKWLGPYVGDQVPAREVKDGLEDAPGSYVKVRAV